MKGSERWQIPTGIVSSALRAEETPAAIGALLVELSQELVAGGFPRADVEREAREIVSALLGVPRFWPLTNANREVDEATRERALIAAGRRAQGAPLAYAVGRAAFRHLMLDVDERALIPRPETELLVDIILELVGPPGGIAVDVGTGSGAVALALATEGRFDRVLATDVSLDALAVAGRNLQLVRDTGALRAAVELAHGDLLAPLRPLLRDGSLVRVVASNPPYIAFAEAESLPASVRDWEPPVALLSAGEGLDVTARLVREAADVLEPGGLLALEADARRASLVAELAARDDRYTNIGVRLDLTGRERFVLARRR
jgi:release factor glutamine methyltransferase